MATVRGQDLHAFKCFVEQQLPADAVPTVDEMIAKWNYEKETADERRVTLEAIGEGLTDVDAGRVMSAKAAMVELRRKHNLPELS
jgi:hypothetical protein